MSATLPPTTLVDAPLVHGALLVRFPGRLFVIPERDLAAPPVILATGSLPPSQHIDLAARLALTPTPHAPGYALCVRRDHGLLQVHVNAEISVCELDALYHLPRLLRHAGCAPWLRGYAFVSVGEKRELALWLDLTSLAT